MTSHRSSNKSKWLDIQGIRGLAILSILGFHFHPKYFPNGYLAVDQFFVLSGFLMCMLLIRSKNLPIFSLITLFYSKRFKRILPLYLLVICCSLIALYTVFPDTAIETNTQSASKAILFISNRPKTDQEDYFQMLSIAVDIFTHTWSLSVEVQFYLIVPFIFIMVNRFRFTYQLIVYGLIGIFSFAFYSFSNEVQAFNSVFARIWQFMIGIFRLLQTVKILIIIGYVVYLNSSNKLSATRVDNTSYLPLCRGKVKLVEKTNNDEFSGESDEERRFGKSKFNLALRYSILFSIISLFVYPTTAPVIIARPFMTISTGILMTISMDDYFLSNKLLTYFGDISYSLYLIHWPIYSYWKLILDNNQMWLLFSLFASIALAVIIFEKFEKLNSSRVLRGYSLFSRWYLQLPSMNLIVLVLILFTSTIFMIGYDIIQQHPEDLPQFRTSIDGVIPNMTLDDAKKFNRRWIIEDMKNLMSSTCEYQDGNGPLGWCVHKGLNKNNKYKMVILGNSWAANHGTLFYQECGYKANSILQGASAYACEPLYPTYNLTKCWSQLTDFEKHVADDKPDFGFISIGNPFPENVSEMRDDPIYQVMKNQLMKLLKNIKKKLYILNAMPPVKILEVNDIVTNLKANLTMSEIDRGLVDLSHYEMARARYAELVKDCGENCEMIDYYNEFYNNSTRAFRFFDGTGFSYFTASNHLTPHGLEKIRHIYHDLCKKL